MFEKIRLNEVVSRDGFQMEPKFIPTADKIDLINGLSDCGYAKIEVTSFVSPKAVPMLRDAGEVMAGIRRASSVKYTALVPNTRGAQRAIEAKIDELNFVMSATEKHNLANLRMSRSDSYKELSNISKVADGRVPINASLSCGFGCAIEGAVEQQIVLEWIARFEELGIREITVCDTVGVASPGQVARMASMLRERFRGLSFTFHFHDTRGMGLANVLVSVQEGVTSFDGSLGGLGGCPYAPGATGNICSEDAANMLETMGYDTGVDVKKLVALACRLRNLVGHDLPSKLINALSAASSREREFRSCSN